VWEYFIGFALQPEEEVIICSRKQKEYQKQFTSLEFEQKFKIVYHVISGGNI
jgi:hypothetical protein